MPNTNENPIKHDKSTCMFCKSIRGFEMPDGLIEQLTKGNVVIFAGAGISTESSTVFPWTFYEDIRGQVKLSDGEEPRFSTLMSKFCERPNGRAELVRQISKRLSYVSSFPELYFSATRFHQELSTLFYIDTIITTNWDDYFERCCGATPLCTAEDFALWNVPGRKVYKIHGSANNLGTIVATDEDYQEAHKSLERGALGSALKLALSTKTVVYVGYSLRDQDFIAIHDYLRAELGDMAPYAYVVSLDTESEGRFREKGLHPIFTDARYFIAVLKGHLETDKHFMSDERFYEITEALERVEHEHSKLHEAFNAHKHPEMIYSACYQDGLMHAFQRITVRKKTGEYSHRCDVVSKLQAYDRIRRDNVKSRRYADVAYIDGYMNGLFFLLGDDEDRKALPYYYKYGEKDQPTSLSQYRRALTKGITHKGASSYAKRLVTDKLGPRDEFHHTPFVGWEVE